MSTMGVGRGIASPNDSAWRFQPPAIKSMIGLWTGNSGNTVIAPPVMRTGVYAMGADGSVWEYAPTAPGEMILLFNGQYLPSITGISPSSATAGTSVTITGSGFTGATAVKFGSTNATSFTVNSDTSITAVSPAVIGTSAITVTTPAGASIGGAQSQFTGLITPTTWNPADKASVTLSNGNLTAIGTATNAGTRAVKGLSSGKNYWECTMVSWVSNTGIGVALATAAFNAHVGNNAATSGILGANGGIYVHGNYQGASLPVSGGEIIGIALDMTNGLIWYRVCPSGNWNNSGTANPAAGAGGFALGSLLPGPLYPFWNGQTINDSVTANFGAGAFSGAVPAGFIAGCG